MDLVRVLSDKISMLQIGEHTPGLKAVTLHLTNAVEHYDWGLKNEDTSSFTDAVYRTNQVFEGSIKEAFRVLASKDPASKTPNENERYLEKHNHLRPRVLSQLSNYRTNWRNPSTHDYRLDFDGDESLLAIVSVAAFAIVLVDQISQRLSIEASSRATSQVKDSLLSTIAAEHPRTLLEYCTELLRQFCSQNWSADDTQTETQLIGSIIGFVSSLDGSIQLRADERVARNESVRADLLFDRDGEQVFVEIKRTSSARALRNGLDQLERTLALARMENGILFVYPPKAGSFKVTVEQENVRGRQVTVISGPVR